MPDETVLRRQARDAVRRGKLPARRPDRTWGGPGVGAPCAVCGEPVQRGQTELEIQFEQEGGSGLDKYHVHVRCFAAWEFERNFVAMGGATAAQDEAAGLVAAVADSQLCLGCIAGIAEVTEDHTAMVITRLQRSITISETSSRCAKCGQTATTYKLG